MGLFNSPVAAPVSSVGFSRATGAVVAEHQLQSWNSLPTLVSTAGKSGFSRVARRKGRLKAVLEESDRKYANADLGRVDVTKEHHSPAAEHFAPPLVSTTCRLRC
jgi:hypothetical protein